MQLCASARALVTRDLTNQPCVMRLAGRRRRRLVGTGRLERYSDRARACRGDRPGPVV